MINRTQGLVLVVFFLGIVRIPVAVFQLSGRWPADGPDWYVVLQAVAGTIQFAIALTMLAGYRRSGYLRRLLRSAARNT